MIVYKTVSGIEVPAITADQMREVDRIAMQEFGLRIQQMMENAGRNLAECARQMLGGTGQVAVLAGTGGNGGGGLCCARHLLNRGIPVTVLLSRDKDSLGEAARQQLNILQTAGVHPADQSETQDAIAGADLVIDALIGYSLHGAPTGRASKLIWLCNEHARSVLSLDVPSGLDASTGANPGQVVRPDRTLTLATKMSNLGSDAPYPTGFYGLEAYYGQMAVLFANATSPEPEVEVVGHSGSDGTYAWAWPDEDLIILYFTQSRGSTSGIKLESRIDELLIHPELQEINAAVREEHAKYLGEYTANFGQFKKAAFTVTVQNGHLALDIPNQIVYELDDPDEEGLRSFITSDEVAISFTLDDGGNVTSLLLHQAGYVFELPKGSPTQGEVYPEDMERYVGTYETEDPNVTMGVVIVEGRLALDIPSQPAALELYPPDENGIWNMRVNPAVAIGFNESEDGEVLSLNLYLPDGTILTRPRIGDT